METLASNSDAPDRTLPKANSISPTWGRMAGRHGTDSIEAVING